MLPGAKEAAPAMAEKIRAHLAVPYVVHAQTMTVTASNGMAV